ncbi:MAG: RluA family pseudouridine synthase [Faecalimonas sp.]|nr:RluA family pseudouridine synthase [Faecalimonas sp.]
MKRTLNYSITSTYENQPILRFLKDEHYSSQVITELKRTPNGIQRNGSWARVRELLHEGDLLRITLEEHCSSANIVPTLLPLDIVYEDEDLLLINKASDMPIHPSQGNYENTLANALAYYYAQKNEHFTYRCINRLDRDTTGLLIVAKHLYSASLLSAMVQKREIEREYLAVATGCVPSCGTIEAPIARACGSTIERCVNTETGEYACTHYRRLTYKNGYSLVSLKLDTGRTHQIRVHMKHIGHPLPGDFLYNPDYSIIQRQALHSHRLRFCHPISGVTMDFTADLPEDMQRFFD